ncbi:hypothetical protein POVWA2_083560 [Plasmodium ovale wallikeri]|uniref:Uncharacterized protein n=1 Tax=Plasmodium ovale wallikeri TaxID=864142 RepID=A0A1A9AFL0_PLAOA|nr:hypothetical protein POVWA1_067340 [Plasmodium ovale wallikeri]SBT58173.1 hypothetical protein POVWA2_083560 [Plasmodium ovale wallikeri]
MSKQMQESYGLHVAHVVAFKTKIKKHIEEQIRKYGYFNCSSIYDKLCRELNLFIKKTKEETLRSQSPQILLAFNDDWNNVEEIRFIKNTFS